MRFVSQIKRKLTSLISISGLIATFIALSGYLISYLLYPAQKYNIGFMGSELGVGRGGIFFNLGLIVSGIFFFLFIIHLDNIINKEETKEIKGKWTIFLAKISAITYSLIGVFPSKHDNLFMLLIHGTLVFICYVTAFFFTLLLSLFFYNRSSFLRLQAYIGFFIAFAILTFLFSWISYIQWIFTLTFFAWIAFINGYLRFRHISEIKKIM
jgi:hypothetical protein